MQGSKPLAFYSRKLNSAQKRYTTGEQELLSIVETLKEFKNILLGQKIIVHTDHKNIIYGNLSNDRIARWRLLLEEFGPTYQHMAGKDNIVADALSRLDATFQDMDELSPEEQGQICAATLVQTTINELYEMPEPTRESMAQAFQTQNDVDNERFPLSPKLLFKEQQKDKKLLKLVDKNKNDYGTRTVEDVKLITHNKKIVVPTVLRQRIVAWYHEYLVHPGSTRMEATLKQNLTWPNLKKDVEQYVRTCHKCQKNKQQRKKYGHLPTKVAETSVPWNRVNVDMIGPYTIQTPTKNITLGQLL